MDSRYKDNILKITCLAKKGNVSIVNTILETIKK